MQLECGSEAVVLTFKNKDPRPAGFTAHAIHLRYGSGEQTAKATGKGSGGKEDRCPQA